MTVHIRCTILETRLLLLTCAINNDDDDDDDVDEIVCGCIASAKQIGCITKSNTHFNHSRVRYQ